MPVPHHRGRQPPAYRQTWPSGGASPRHVVVVVVVDVVVAAGVVVDVVESS